MLEIVLKGIGIVFLGIIVLSLFQFFLSIHPPKFIDTGVPSDYGFEYEDVEFKTADGIVIRGWLLVSDDATGTVVIGHGYPFDKGNIFPVASFLFPDYNLLFYDHRSFGASDGFFSTVGLKETKDVEAAVAYVEKEFDGPIGLYGFSLSAASMLMSSASVDAIVADSPYANLDLMIHHVYGMFGPFRYPFVWVTEWLSWGFFGKFPRQVSPADAVVGKDVPILLMHGDKDSQIPVSNSLLIKAKNNDIDLWVIKGADHGQGFALQPHAYENRVKDFLKKNME